MFSCPCEATSIGWFLPKQPRHIVQLENWNHFTVATFDLKSYHHCRCRSTTVGLPLLRSMGSNILQWLRFSTRQYLSCNTSSTWRISSFKSVLLWSVACKDLENSRFLKRVWRIGYMKEAKATWQQRSTMKSNCLTVSASKNQHAGLNSDFGLVHLRNSLPEAWLK